MKLVLDGLFTTYFLITWYVVGNTFGIQSVLDFFSSSWNDCTGVNILLVITYQDWS